MATGDVGFWNRLLGIRDPGNPDVLLRLPVDPFWDALTALAVGWNTKAQIVSYFALDSDGQAGLDELIGWYNAQPDAEAKSRFILLGRAACRLSEQDTPGYTTPADIKSKMAAL